MTQTMESLPVKKRFRIRRRRKAAPKQKKEDPFHLNTFIKDSISVITGIIFATVGLEGFIIPNGLLDGGVTGISLLLASVTHTDVSIFIFLINLPFIFMGYRQVSRLFALKTLLAIITLSCVLWLLHAIHFPIITKDKLLIAVFGGLFLGAGIGLAMRGGCVIDGTEVLALYLTRKASLQVGEVILLINIFIFGIAALVHGLEVALYSVLAYMAASKTVDFLTNGIEEYTGVLIISEQNEKIRKQIVVQLGRGVTIFNGKRGLRGKKAKQDGLNDMDIIYTVVTKLELAKVRNIVHEIDPACFMTTQSINSVRGGMVKTRKLH